MKPSNFNSPYQPEQAHKPKRNSFERKTEMSYRRHRQRTEVPNAYAVIVSKYIPAGVHRNVALSNR
jgi:hypothetical protein